MAGFGALAGALSHVALGGASSPWALGLAAGGAMLGAVFPALQSRMTDLVAGLGLLSLGASALVLGTRTGLPAAGLIVFAVLFGTAMAWGLSGRRRLVAIAAGAGVALLARYVFHSFAFASQLSTLPSWVVATISGAAFSFVAVFALLPRHLELYRDLVGASYVGLHGAVTGEVRDLVSRGHDLWIKAADELESSPTTRSALEQGVLRLFTVAQRWQTVEKVGTSSMTASLNERMEALEKRIAETEDEITRTQYQEARDALAEQLRYIKDIRVSRERVLARMHNYLAAMERLRLAALNLRSADASRDPAEVTEVEPLLSSLKELGADMDASSDALLEAERLAAK